MVRLDATVLRQWVSPAVFSGYPGDGVDAEPVVGGPRAAQAAREQAATALAAAPALPSWEAYLREALQTVPAEVVPEVGQTQAVCGFTWTSKGCPSPSGRRVSASAGWGKNPRSHRATTGNTFRPTSKNPTASWF